jgi:hypothetical protein
MVSPHPGLGYNSCRGDGSGLEPQGVGPERYQRVTGRLDQLQFSLGQATFGANDDCYRAFVE